MSENPETVARVSEQLRKAVQTDGAVRCGICGSDIEGLATVCSSCEAPYHADCWKYNSGCAVYGCRAAPQPPPPVEVEVTLRITGEADGPFAGRPRAKAVRWACVSLLGAGALAAVGLGFSQRPLPSPAKTPVSAEAVVAETPRSHVPKPEARPHPSKSHWPALLEAATHDPSKAKKSGQPEIDIIFIDPSLGDRSPAKPPDIDNFVRESKGADWEARVFYLESLATSQEPKAQELLLSALKDEKAIGNVREAAARTLGKRRDILAVPNLVERARCEPVAQVRAEVALALDRIGSPHGRVFLGDWLAAYKPGKGGARPSRDDAKVLAMHAAQAAAKGKMEEFRPAIEAFLTDSDPWVLAFTLGNLGTLGARESGPAVARLLGQPDCGTVMAAALALADLGAREYRGAIESRLAKCPAHAGQVPGLLARLDGRTR